MRFIKQGIVRNGHGDVIADATISVYLGGTTTPVSVYAASTGGTAVNSVTSSADGSFIFYVDESDYDRTQLFKLVLTNGDAFTTQTWDDVLLMDASTIGANTVVNGGTGVVGNIPVFDSVTGKSITDSGVPLTNLTAITDLATGELLIGDTAGDAKALAGNATATKRFLTETGTGAAAQDPNWGNIGPSDITDALEEPPPIGDSTPNTGLFSILGSFIHVYPVEENVTISGGVIEVTNTRQTIDTEDSAASDDLETLSGGNDGQMIYLCPASADRTIVIKDTGNIVTRGSDIVLDDTNQLVPFIYDGNQSKWIPCALPLSSTSPGDKDGLQGLLQSMSVSRKDDTTVYVDAGCIDISGKTYRLEERIEVSDITLSYSDDLCTGGTATASSNFQGIYPPERAFDNDPAVSWISYSGSPQWIQYDFGVGTTQTAIQYKLTVSNPVQHAWGAWTFQGSNNGSSFTTIDTQTGITWTNGETKTFNSFTNTTAYRYYRFDITSFPVYAEMAEIEIMGPALTFSAGDTAYVYCAPPVGEVLSAGYFRLSNSDPTWDNDRGGYYHPLDTTQRAIASFVMDGSAHVPTEFTMLYGGEINPISDTAYASSWNGVTTVAPSKNAVYDKINAMVSDDAYAAGWDNVTDVAPSKNAVYDKIEGIGGALVSDDAYASGWGSITTVAPSKNAIYDKVETIVNNLPNRNIIINGAMDIWQRGTSFTAPINNSYTTDRWHVNHSMSDGVIDVSQDAVTPISGFPFQYAMKVDCTHIETAVAATEYLTVRYKVEGYDYAKIIGRTCTLSFWVKAVKTGIYCVAFRNSANNRSYVVEYTINSASTWEKKTVTLIFNSDGTWLTTTGVGVSIAFVVMCGTDGRTATTDAWVAGNYIATSNQVNGLDNTNNNFWLTGVQLEVGSAATPFEIRNYATELLACQRYCYSLTSLVAYQDVNIGMATSSTVLLVGIPCPTKFRAIPTLTATAGDWIIYPAGDATGMAMNASSGAESMQWIDVTRSGGGMTTGAFYPFIPDDTVGRTLIFSADL